MALGQIGNFIYVSSCWSGWLVNVGILLIDQKYFNNYSFKPVLFLPEVVLEIFRNKITNQKKDSNKLEIY